MGAKPVGEKSLGEKSVQEEFLGEESLGEKYMDEKYTGERLWVKSLWVKSIWVKSLWVKNHGGKIGVDGMLAFVPPFSGIVITCVFFLNEAYTHTVPMSHVSSLYNFTSDPSCSCIGVSLVLILQVSTPAVWCGFRRLRTSLASHGGIRWP